MQGKRQTAWFIKRCLKISNTSNSDKQINHFHQIGKIETNARKLQIIQTLQIKQ